MRRIETLYLAGPEVWFPDAGAHLARCAALCAEAGFRLLTADPAALKETEPGEVMAREIYAERVSRLRRADAAIVNLTPWRGPGADPGAAFEAGFLAGLAKPVLGWMNVPAEEHADYLGRVDAWMGARPDETGVWRDGDGCAIEDMGLPETVMLWAEARRLFVVETDDLIGDLTGLKLCLDALKLYAEE